MAHHQRWRGGGGGGVTVGPGNAGEKSISEGLACAYMQRVQEEAESEKVELRKQQKEGRIVLIKRVCLANGSQSGTYFLF